jgi:hypothetical protein
MKLPRYLERFKAWLVVISISITVVILFLMVVALFVYVRLKLTDTKIASTPTTRVSTTAYKFVGSDGRVSYIQNPRGFGDLVESCGDHCIKAKYQLVYTKD